MKSIPAATSIFQKLTRKNYKLPILFLTFLSFKTVLCQKIDSINVYYLPMNFLSHIPVTDHERLKIFPITNYFSVTDTSTLLLISQSIKELEKTDISFKVLDIRIVCELYYKWKKKRLLINGVKYIHYKKRQFKPSEKLLKALYPAGA